MYFIKNSGKGGTEMLEAQNLPAEVQTLCTEVISILTEMFSE
jgi:hypothetical protein